VASYAVAAADATPGLARPTLTKDVDAESSRTQGLEATPDRPP